MHDRLVIIFEKSPVGPDLVQALQDSPDRLVQQGFEAVAI
jgi:hypothetical protein